MYLCVTVSIVVSVLISIAYFYSPLGVPWEHEDQPMVFSITWHSGVVFLALTILIYAALSSVHQYRRSRVTPKSH